MGWRGVEPGLLRATWLGPWGTPKRFGFAEGGGADGRLSAGPFPAQLGHTAVASLPLRAGLGELRDAGRCSCKVGELGRCGSVRRPSSERAVSAVTLGGWCAAVQRGCGPLEERKCVWGLRAGGARNAGMALGVPMS